MKLDRNENQSGMGKYALLKLRNWPTSSPAKEQAAEALLTLCDLGMVDYGITPETEFFVMRLKDKYALKGLMGYHRAVSDDDTPDLEYAQEILDMAKRSGLNSAYCKLPD